MPNIHPTAIVSSKAEIGENTTVGAYAFIEDDVIIGSNCTIMNHASILDGSRIGNEVRIHQSAVISGLPQDLKYAGEKTTCHVGDRTVIREFATLNRGTDDKWKTVIGADNLIMAYVHIAHDVITKDKVILANSVQVAGHCEIGFHVTIGGMTPVHQFVRIGDHAFIGGGLRVHKDVPPYVLAMGEPLGYGGLNKVGLERRGFSVETREEIQKAYRTLYHSGLIRSDAIERIKDEQEMIPEIETLIAFIESSERGTITAKRRT